MTFRKYERLAIIGMLTMALAGGTALARGRGGGGGGGSYRGGGGGVSRPSYSGSGSIRYSSPSRSYSRPTTPSYSRPATPSYARPAAPSYRPSAPVAAPRPAGGYTAARPATPSYRISAPGAAQRPAAGSPVGGSISRPESSVYRPPNSGSIIHSGTITGPGGNTIGGAVGPRGGTAVGIKGAEGGAAGAIKGPGGGGAAGIKGPEGGAAGAVRGPGGAGAAGVRGPEGGAAGAVRGPGGGAAAGVVGPGGGAAGAVRGPGGAGAAGIKGPGGAAAGPAWGPGGRGVAAARGPYGNRYVTTLPGGALHYPWHGYDYWHVGFNWWTPCWVGDSAYYGWAYPPIGFYYSSLPANYSTTVINNTTYYESEGVYYQEGEQDGKKGYVVAEAPVNPEESAGGGAEAAGEDPFKILKGMCDYVAGLDKFSLVAQTTNDEVRESGEKVQVSARRIIYVDRPDKLAVDVTGDNGARRVVYDGTTVSMLDRTKNVYTVIKVPNTIDATLDALADNYGIIVPLEDLLYKDLYERVLTRVSEGQYLGLHMVDSLKCHHLAFSAGTSNWEVWIEAGEKPVLRRITIDYGQDAARLRYAADIAGWNPSPAFTWATFDFRLPAGVKRFEIAPTTPPAATGKAGQR
jgi:hypothetical protein